MGLLGFIVMLVLSGLIVGALGRLAVPGPDPMSIGRTIIVGIVGSLVGGLIGRALFGDRVAPGLLLSVGGAALLVLVLRQMRPRPR
jgi:uncharacterized membrane protein YeaQ/YmgE (transglycosylase-associated protein family)